MQTNFGHVQFILLLCLGLNKYIDYVETIERGVCIIFLFQGQCIAFRVKAENQKTAQQKTKWDSASEMIPQSTFYIA